MVLFVIAAVPTSGEHLLQHCRIECTIYSLLVDAVEVTKYSSVCYRWMRL